MKFTDWFTQHKDADIRARVRGATLFHMSDKERAEGREFLMRYVALHPAHATPAVSRYAFLFHPMPIIASLLIVVVSGVSVAGAAERSLPGETLYSIKVNVNEEMRLALATTPERKADIALERAERRLQELTILTQRGIVDETLRAEIDDRIDEHVHDAEEKSVEIDTPEARDVEQRVVAVLRAHEALVAPGEMGGNLENEMLGADVSVASLAIAEEPASSERALAAVPDETSVAPADATSMMMVMSAEPAPEPVIETVRVANDAPATMIAKSPAPVSEKILKRQEKAARERIASLEKLIAREEKRNERLAKQNEKRENVVDTSVLRAGLENAHDAFTNAEAALAAGNSFDASALFNNAVRTAIDARETYADRERADDSRDTQDSNDTRTDDSTNETNDDRDIRSRDRDRDDD